MLIFPFPPAAVLTGKTSNVPANIYLLSLRTPVLTGLICQQTIESHLCIPAAEKHVKGMECSVDQQEDREGDDRDDNRPQTDLGTMPADFVSPESGSTESTAQVMAQLPPKRKISQKHVANITRATLQQLKELTYLSQDTDTLTEVTKELRSLISKLITTVF